MSLLIIPFPLHTPSALLLSLTSSYSLVETKSQIKCISLTPLHVPLWCWSKHRNSRWPHWLVSLCDREHRVGLMLPGSHAAFPQSIHSSSRISDISHCLLLGLPFGQGLGRLRTTEENFHNLISYQPAFGFTSSASLPPAPCVFSKASLSTCVLGPLSSVQWLLQQVSPLSFLNDWFYSLSTGISHQHTNISLKTSWKRCVYFLNLILLP